MLALEISFVSSDEQLQRVCREILGEILGSGWIFTPFPNGKVPVTFDLCIWDYTPDMELPDLEPCEWRRHVVLVQRKHVPLLRSKNFPEVNLILKPVTRATLRTFFDQAVQRFHGSQVLPGNIDSLRADRDELLQCLVQANLRLQEYDQERTNFLARAVHDFRAPLTALNGYCGLLLGEELGNLTPVQKEVLQRMQHSAKRLFSMTEAMFQLSIWQRVDNRPILSKRDIQEPIEQALHEVHPLAEEKRITINMDIIPSPESLAFEESQIVQVLVNLLDNACKFTPRGGNIEIVGYPYFWERRRSTDPHQIADNRTGVNLAPNAYRVDVRDSGPGIPQSQLDLIFEEYTAYAGGADRSGGGLGLAICKMILSRHHGHVWAERSAGGAVFSFVLPFHRQSQVNGSGPKIVDAKVVRTERMELNAAANS